MVKYQYMHTLEALIEWLDDHADHFRNRIKDYESPAMSAVLAYASDGKPSPDLPKPGSSSYYKYRSQLKKQLIHEVLAINPVKLENQDREVACLQCQQWLHALEVLARTNGEAIAADLLKKVWQTAEAFAFTDLQLAAARWVWRLQALVPDSIAPLSLDTDTRSNLATLCQYEDLAEETYYRLAWENNASLIDVTMSPEVAHDIATQLGIIPADAESFKLHVLRELIQSRLDARERDFPALLARNQALLLYLKNQNFQDNWSLQRVFLNLLEGYAQTQDPVGFEDCLDQALPFVTRGSSLWIKYYDLGVRLSMATGAFYQCDQYFQEVVGSKSLVDKPAQLQEQWRIYAAYLKFIQQVRPEVIKGKNRSNTFRLGKFMNETPVFSKDKQGMNIPILIVQFLILLTQKKYHKLIDRAEALAKYQSRYLQQDEWFRSQCFLKMLMQLPANNFHRQAVERKTEDWLSRLDKRGTQKKTGLSPCEIIPYDILWKWILASLDNQFHGKQKSNARKRLA